MQMQSYGTVLKTESRPQKKIYNLIPYQSRKALVDLVVTEGLSVYRASRVLGIKNTTAKAIMRRFRRQGTIFKRKHQADNQDGRWSRQNPNSSESQKAKQSRRKTLEKDSNLNTVMWLNKKRRRKMRGRGTMKFGGTVDSIFAIFDV